MRTVVVKEKSPPNPGYLFLSRLQAYQLLLWANKKNLPTVNSENKKIPLVSEKLLLMMLFKIS